MGLFPSKQTQKPKEEPKKELTIEEKFDIEITKIKQEFDELETKYNSFVELITHLQQLLESTSVEKETSETTKEINEKSNEDKNKKDDQKEQKKLKQIKTEKEIEKIESQGIEVYELHMRIVLRLDNFVELDDERRNIRRESNKIIQQRLDLIEKYQLIFKELL